MSSVVMGGVFTAMNAMNGGVNAHVLRGMFVRNAGALYLFNILQCPMAAISGGRRNYHAPLSGAILGYVGVETGRLAVPFVSYDFFYKYPNIKPALVGGVMYGGLVVLFQMASAILTNHY
jgi:hypothetical protein